MIELSRHELPSHKKVDGFEIDIKRLQNSYYEIKEKAVSNEDIHCGRGNEIIDLTYLDPDRLRYTNTRFFGTSTERALNNKLKMAQTTSTKKRLRPGLITNPLQDDRNHIFFKSWVPDNYLMTLIKGFGDIAKVSLATLEPNSWWPAHYDFDHNHSCKVNIPILTNEKAFSLSWRPREKKLDECLMEEGDLWWLNTALKHTAVNWGETPRTYLLVTFQSNNFFKENVLENI